MPPTASPCDLAYTTALVAACQRIWAAPDLAAFWPTVVDEALALIDADGAAVVTYTGRCWQTLAARPSDAAPDDSAAAAVLEMLFRQGLLQQPISIDEPAEGASWDGVGGRAVLVVSIEGAPQQPVRLAWYATGTGTLSPHIDVAEAFAHHASLALGAAMERDNLNRAVAARHRVGLTGPRTLDDPPSADGRPGVRSAETRVAEHPREATNDRSEGHSDRRSAGLVRRVRPDDPSATISRPWRDPQASSFRFVPPAQSVTWPTAWPTRDSAKACFLGPWLTLGQVQPASTGKLPARRAELPLEE